MIELAVFCVLYVLSAAFVYAGNSIGVVVRYLATHPADALLPAAIPLMLVGWSMLFHAFWLGVCMLSMAVLLWFFNLPPAHFNWRAPAADRIQLDRGVKK